MAKASALSYVSAAEAANAADGIFAVMQLDRARRHEFWAQMPDGEWEFLRASSRSYRFAHIYREAINGNLAPQKLGAYVQLTNSPNPTGHERFLFRETIKIRGENGESSR